MRLFSYLVARDYGFAPNPFFEVCTLATCKPQIRSAAQVGDWVVGTGSKSQGRESHLVFAMKVTETMTFNDYWHDDRFQCKKPNLAGSRKQAFGDNIYHSDGNGGWHQANSHHSYADGQPNKSNIRRDTGVDCILLSDRFLYFGSCGPEIPGHIDICKRGPGHRCHFPDRVVNSFFNWLCSLEYGFHAPPGDWANMHWTPWNELT